MTVKLAKPILGMPCTVCSWTDSYAATVTRVSGSGKTIHYRRDKSEIIEGSCYDGSAKYAYFYDKDAYEEKATLRKDGYYRATGTNYFINLGRKHTYYDPSF